MKSKGIEEGIKSLPQTILNQKKIYLKGEKQNGENFVEEVFAT